MADTRNEIRAFLPGDLFSLIPSAFGLSSGDVYFANVTRERNEASEVQLTWGGRANDPTCIENELRVHAVIITLYRKIRDSYATDDFQTEMESAAETITAAYNDNPDRFENDITNDIDFVTCTEIDGGPNWQKHRVGATIVQRLALNIGVHEAPRS